MRQASARYALRQPSASSRGGWDGEEQWLPGERFCLRICQLVGYFLVLVMRLE